MVIPHLTAKDVSFCTEDRHFFFFFCLLEYVSNLSLKKYFHCAIYAVTQNQNERIKIRAAQNGLN